MLHAAAAGNSEQQVKVLTPTSGKQKHPPPWRGPPLLMGSQPRYNVLPLTKLTASLHYTPSACRPECADARRVPDTQACLSDGPAAAAAALPPPPPKWRRTASAGTRRGAASGGGERTTFPRGRRAPGRCDWPAPQPNQRGGGGQGSRRCSPAEASGRAAGGNMALGTRAPRRLLHLPAGSCLLLLLLLLLLLCGQLGGGQKKKEVETFASFAIAPGRGAGAALPCRLPLGSARGRRRRPPPPGALRSSLFALPPPRAPPAAGAGLPPPAPPAPLPPQP